MKKIIAGIMAVTMTTCMFASCGDKDDSGSSSKGYEKVVTDFVKAANDKDADALIKCIMPDAVVDGYKDMLKDAGMDWDDMKEEFVSDFEDEVGESGKVSVDIKSSKKVDDLSDVQEYVDDMYDSLGADDDHEVSEAYELDVVLSAENEDEDNEETICSYKLDGDWYLMLD